MQESVFNALPVVSTRGQALALTIGDFFLFTEDAWQQNNPSINRITYWQRIAQDRTGGPFPLSSNIELNYTHAIQPVTAGGPFPPSGAGYTEIYYPAQGVIKGQGGVGYIKINDFFETEPSSLSSSSVSSSSSSSESSSSSSSSSSVSVSSSSSSESLSSSSSSSSASVSSSSSSSSSSASVSSSSSSSSASVSSSSSSASVSSSSSSSSSSASVSSSSSSESNSSSSSSTTPQTVTYRMNSYSTSAGWNNPDQAIDLSAATYSNTTTVNAKLRLDENESDGSDLGTISKVEMRAIVNVQGFSAMTMTPYFLGVSGGSALTGVALSPEAPSWIPWEDITSDTNAPGSWDWIDVRDLDIEFEMTAFSGGDVQVYIAEIRVTYS